MLANFDVSYREISNPAIALASDYARIALGSHYWHFYFKITVGLYFFNIHEIVLLNMCLYIVVMSVFVVRYVFRSGVYSEPVMPAHGQVGFIMDRHKLFGQANNKIYLPT